MKIVLLVAVLALAGAGSALKCYKCNGCETASNVKETCKNVDPETQINVCLTQRIRTGGTDSMTIKKCAVQEKGKPFECQELPTGDTVLCQQCMSDFCNSGSKITSSLFLFIFVALVPIVLARF